MPVQIQDIPFALQEGGQSQEQKVFCTHSPIKKATLCPHPPPAEVRRAEGARLLPASR